MPTKIFVGRLADGTTSDEIGNLFRKFGHVTECDVLQNFGFVVSAVIIASFQFFFGLPVFTTLLSLVILCFTLLILC